MGRPRRWGHRQVVGGKVGPIVGRHGKALLVDLAQVEAAVGETFTRERLEAAGLRISEPQQEMPDGSQK
jgi:hypothetical protein